MRTVNEFVPKASSLIIVFSPLLGYGLKELWDKLPESSFVLAVESNEELFAFSKPFLSDLPSPVNFAFKNFTSSHEFVNFLETDLSLSRFTAVQCLNLSGGTFFSEDFNANLAEIGQNLIFAYWKNRITLISLGKLFCKNFFRNLPLLSHARVPALRSVESPILVLGAGISCDEIFRSNILKNGNFFIIAVDVTATALLTLGIPCHLVVLTETQCAIDKAFVGVSRSTPILCDLTSRSAIARQFENLSFTFLQFTQSEFLKRIGEEAFMPHPFSPLGSVGLDAMRMALLLRKNKDVPVIFSGMDFCYRLGKTHFCGASQSIVAQSTATRLTGMGGFSQREDLFQTSARGFYSDKTMASYGALFCDYFADEKNVFDASLFENSQFPKISPDKVSDFASKKPVTQQPFTDEHFAIPSKITEFFARERKNLLELQKILSKNPDDEAISALSRHDYLYLHFPDGHKISREENFLRRVRGEISDFLKIMNF